MMTNDDDHDVNPSGLNGQSDNNDPRDSSRPPSSLLAGHLAPPILVVLLLPNPFEPVHRTSSHSRPYMQLFEPLLTFNSSQSPPARPCPASKARERRPLLLRVAGEIDRFEPTTNYQTIKSRNDLLLHTYLIHRIPSSPIEIGYHVRSRPVTSLHLHLALSRHHLPYLEHRQRQW